MTFKQKVNEFVNVRKLVHRIYIILWVVLAICLILKFAFNWWFPIVVKNETFINICDFFDKNEIAKYILMGIFYVLSYNFTLPIAFKFKNSKIKRKYLLLLNLGYVTFFVLKIFFQTIINILEMFVLIGLPIIYHIKKHTFKRLVFNILYGLITYGITFLWQLNVLLIRDIQEVLSNASTLVIVIMQIDYYIFIILMYMEVNNMGLLGQTWLWGKSETELLALKEAELKKEYPDEKKIKDIDAKLEELKAEAK